MRVLDADQTRAALGMEACIAAMRPAFSDERVTPVRTELAGSLFMPGAIPGASGIKVVSVVPGNPVGIVMVFTADGTPLGSVDGATLTAIRTGAASGLVTDLLASPEAATLAMLGTGAMAADQVAGVRTVRPIERVLVWSRSPERARAFAAQVGGEAVESAANAVANADVVCTATPANAPLFDAASVSAGTHFNAVGAFRPDMVELPAELIERAFVVVDDRAAAAEEAGDLLQANVAPDAEVADLLERRATAPPEAITVFKSVGIASQDVAAAYACLTAAKERGIGTEV